MTIYRDTTARAQAEEALRESEKKRNAILHAFPVGIGLVINRKLDWANETMYKIVGFMNKGHFWRKAPESFTALTARPTEILDRGCDGFIQKHFKMKELSQKLRDILDEK